MSRSGRLAGAMLTAALVAGGGAAIAANQGGAAAPAKAPAPAKHAKIHVMKSAPAAAVTPHRCHHSGAQPTADL